jgi:ferredoxin
VFRAALTTRRFVMRVEVDRDRCEGNAVCIGIAPDLFDLDDEDYAVVKSDPVPDDQQDLAEQAIAECPRAALIRRD